MLVYLVLHVISATTAFLYPTYASYKTLSKRPANESDIERWLMYWAVLGTIVGTEYIAGWAISWIPFYIPIKTLFLLYISLPYTQGSSYIYTKHLHPFLLANEAEIDLKIGEVRGKFWEYLAKTGRTALTWFANVVGVGGGVAGAGVGYTGAIGGNGNAGGDDGAGMGMGVNSGRGLDSPPFGPHMQIPPPSANTAMMTSGPAQVVLGLWRTYGPQVAALIQQAPDNVPTITATGHAHQYTSTSTSTSSPTSIRSPIADQTTMSQPTIGTSTAVDKHHDLQLNYAQIIARRRALEAEIAALPPVPMHDPSASMLSGASTVLTSHPYRPSSPPLARPPSGDFDKGKYIHIKRDEDEEDGDEFGDLDVVDDGHDHDENNDARFGAGSGSRTFWWWGRENSQAKTARYERVKTE